MAFSVERKRDRWMNDEDFAERHDDGESGKDYF